MKRKLPIILSVVILLCTVFAITLTLKNDATSPIDQARLTHEQFLLNSPLKGSEKLSKQDKFDQGLPPNKYFEREWELTMNPTLGRPTPENLRLIQANMQSNFASRVPGDATDNNWVERGPNNVGGRSRAIMFDPNDASNQIVFAAGVSGGLWRNSNITSANSVWARVAIPDNLNVTCIISDPNNSNIFYVGTGESYTSGDVNGSGVWKSIDGGVSWANVFGGIEGETTFETSAKVTVNSPASVAGDYAAIPAAFGPAITTPFTGNLKLATPNDGCSALTNAAQLNGNIAVIYRGTCPFVDKVSNAQAAGAVAVIMINNVEGTPIVMGGTNFTINIPSLMISKNDGETIMNAIASGINVTLAPNPGVSFPNSFVLSGNQHVSDVIVRNNAGVSEVYVAASANGYFASNPITLLGPDSAGLYKSTNAGNSWTLSDIPLTAAGNKHEPNDLEIGADNTLWVTTKNSVISGDGGGKIFSTTDGVNFTLRKTLTASRTQIAASPTNAQKLYVLAQGTTSAAPVVMVKTEDGFTTTTNMALPNDADNGIPANDFTRSQAFYDLVIKVDPANDANVFVGGIDLFRSVNSGATWSQFSHWYGGFGFQDVHADQHAIAFANGNSSRMLFGNDGGVYYSNNSGVNTVSRNNGFNVTQFYSVAVGPTTAYPTDNFIGGAQDNGSQFFANASPGINSSVDVSGGDGGSMFFDQDGVETFYITNYVWNNSIKMYNTTTGVSRTINNESSQNGDFINQLSLDSNLNILYSNYSSSTNYIVRRYNFAPPFTQTYNLTNALLASRPSALKVSPYSITSSKLLVGTDTGKLLRIDNADTYTSVWSDITGPDFFGSISDIEFGQTENDIFVTMHNYGVQNIYYSNDGGSSWMAKEGDLPDLPVKTIVQNPLNLEEVFIGTELGVWYTANFSAANPNWHSSFNGMSNVKVTDLDIRKGDNVVFASTYGRGIFSGTLTANSLTVKDSEISKNSISLYPTISNGEVTIATISNLGLLKLDIFSINGQKVYSAPLNLNGNKKSLKLNLASGTYVAKFTKDNFSETIKMIIK